MVANMLAEEPEEEEAEQPRTLKRS
jgi:hypothetical protein